jgi:hypothetical protein
MPRSPRGRATIDGTFSDETSFLAIPVDHSVSPRFARKQALGRSGYQAGVGTRRALPPHAFEPAYAQNDFDHRLTKAKHPWTDGHVERMKRTLNEATVERYFTMFALAFSRREEAADITNLN